MPDRELGNVETCLNEQPEQRRTSLMQARPGATTLDPAVVAFLEQPFSEEQRKAAWRTVAVAPIVKH